MTAAAPVPPTAPSVAAALPPAAPAAPHRLLLAGARVLAADARSAPHRDLLIEGDRIAALLPPGTPVEAAERLDAADRLCLPGLVNAHTHGHGGLSKGMGDKWDLALLLAHAPWVGGGRGLEAKRISTRLTAVEMLRKGCVAGFDLAAEFPGPTADGLLAMGEAYAAVGLRAVLAPMIADLNFFQATPGLVDALPPEHRARAAAMRMPDGAETLATIDALARRWPAGPVRLGLGPTIPLHGTDGFLRGCAALAAEHGLPVQTHVAEARYQAAAGAERYGTTLLRHLDAMGLVTPRFSAAHGVWLTEADLALLAERGAGLAHNPGANMRLASGIAPVRRALRAGVTVGIGTDGSGSSDNQNMFAAMRLAAFASRLLEDEDWLGAAETLHLATAGSRALLGLEGDGTLTPGQPADLLLLDLRHVNWAPFNDAAQQLVFTEDGAALRDVMVAGQWRLRDGAVLGLDEQQLFRDAEAVAAEIRATTAEVRGWCEAIAPAVACHCAGLAKHFTGARRLLRAE
ncbi:amidohydrolase family protein [Roseomonas sp. BN140053]|uniref:amidohydrolase family protein n=1 Tax=Roseomonas sp. BN140053 TaxID=3391898 RepID=UPI0039E73AE0